MDEKIKEIREDLKRYQINTDFEPSNNMYCHQIEFLLSEYERLEEKQKWIDEVARPDHPDDERPWCAAYLDCRARVKGLELALKQYKLNYAEAIGVKHTVIEEINKAEARIKELEEKIQLAEATRDDALAYAKGYKSELAKWTSPHENDDLQWMKEQSHQSSFAAKQAYINALEWTIKHREAKVKELEEGIKRHKNILTTYDSETSKFGDNWDYELYKLIEEKP